MKKLPDKSIPRRKLVLRGESITVLTSMQLDQVQSGITWPIFVCGGESYQHRVCTHEPI